MKVQVQVQDSLVNNNVGIRKEQKINRNAPTFKSAGVALLNSSGAIMKTIENQGFWLIFIIQDVLGMTIPRTWVGLKRDKDITGEYNMHEAKEVFGREGLTGPCMMAVAPLGFAIAGLFGKSTKMNSKLIRRFGNNLKEFVSKSENKTLLNDKTKFKNEFYRDNLNKILTETYGKENVSNDLIEDLLKAIKEYETKPTKEMLNGKSKKLYNKEKYAKIQDLLVNNKYNTSDNLENILNLKFEKDSFSIKNTIDGMIKYSNDAIEVNKHLDKLDALETEKIKDTAVAKRVLSNILIFTSTIATLSVLPKIYASSKISPAERTANLLKQKEEESAKKQTNNSEAVADTSGSNKQTLAFKGKLQEGHNSDSIGLTFKANPSNKGLSALGKFLSKFYKDKHAGNLEYDGHNFTMALMSTLSIGGIIAPRVAHSYKRAPKDEKTGKKNLSEVWENAIRDLISSLTVIFFVPMGTRALVSAYEKASGFVLLDKNRKTSKTQKTLDLLNPFSKNRVLLNQELDAIYNKIDSPKKMLNFCNFIKNNDGDLSKIFSKSDKFGEIFNKNTLDLNSLKDLDRKSKNQKIIEYIENLSKTESNKSKDLVDKLMSNSGIKKNNRIASFARGLNSIPGVLVTFALSPILLGVLLPKLTYANTRRQNSTKPKEEQQIAVNKTV